MSAPLLIGYDGTAGSEAALREGLRLAAALGVEVVLAYAVRLNPAGGEVKDFATALEEHAQTVLDQGLARAREAGVRGPWRTRARPRARRALRARGDHGRSDDRRRAGPAPAHRVVVGSSARRPCLRRLRRTPASIATRTTSSSAVAITLTCGGTPWRAAP